MDMRVITTIFLSVFKAALCFNIDPVAWKSLSNRAAGFGYQVVQRNGGDLLVSAPLAQYSSSGRGQIYKCSTSGCGSMSIPLPEFAVNASLGLTMTYDPIKQNTLACGPTIPKDCTSITLYNGLCIMIDRLDNVEGPVPSTPEVCRSQADVAFLLDGSGSVSSSDFTKMKGFVKDLVRSFQGTDTKFAIAQFSTSFQIEVSFNTFNTRYWEQQINSITQISSGTNTAGAIYRVVHQVFITSKGSRPNVKKVLIVITDGESYDSGFFPKAIREADKKNIVRFAIGVGNAFQKESAKNELNIIASSPSVNHVFQVNSFDALEIIRQNLRDKIFSIEGSQTAGETLKMEMSQAGFSAAHMKYGFQMGIVGANQWKGGYQRYTSRGQKTSSYEPTNVDEDSYLGYSMAVAQTSQGTLTILGAPRYQHRGAVMAVQENNQHKQIDPNPLQSGAYFGAEVCAMDVDGDDFSDIILISSPMFSDTDREGRVYVCSLTDLTVDCNIDDPFVLRGDASATSRFGSSLAVVPDLNQDGLNDLVIGAPLENDGQGSIYIFNSEGRKKIREAYSQRIAGSEVQSGLKFFGTSISQSSFDLSNDGLPDLAVGSKGSVILLRSKPIVIVEAAVSFSPGRIPTQNTSCSVPLQSIAKICFRMKKHSEVNQARAKITYSFTLDATRKTPNNRAYITGKQREETKSTNLDLQQPKCVDVNFFIEACPEDAFNDLYNELRFTFQGLPSRENLSPSLAPQVQTMSIHPLGFEINCGTDNICVDKLKLDFNFSQSLEVRLGIDDLLNITVSIENSMENSYNSRVILTYPTGLSYRKFTALQGRIECNSFDSENDFSRGKTDCTIDKPIFQSNSKAFFIVSYGIGTDSQLDQKIFVTANATSGNQEHSSSSQLYSIKWINVKYTIFVVIESTLSYNNFTFGNDNLQKPVMQTIRVTNDIRAFNLTVVIKVPVKLGNKDIWVDLSNLQIPDCQIDKDEEPGVTDFVAQIKTNKIVDCSVARCRVFRCSGSMKRLEVKSYKIAAKLSSGWIQQIGLESAKFLLTSTASLEYDRNQYIFFSSGSNNTSPVHKIQAEVEVYSEPNFTYYIIGGCVGGLVLLALIAGGLYKAGFFKSKYQKMIQENAGADNPGADVDEPTPELT